MGNIVDRNPLLINKKTRIKNFGGIYTPNHIVREMLDLVKYKSSAILCKHILENSCGDGAFLCEIVKRYCQVFFEENENKKDLKKQLSTFIHGIEINKSEYLKCIENLELTVSEFGIENVSWDVRNEDALINDTYNGKMDFVVGNPPYVRIHNLRRNYLKNFCFTQSGMIDLYLAFFEIGFKQLNYCGKMCYITPSSFFFSKSGKHLREYIQKNRNLKTVVDLGNTNVFKNAATYTVITVFDNKKNIENVNFKVYGESEFQTLPYRSMFIKNQMVFNSSSISDYLLNLDNFYHNHKDGSILVKNGFATLADSVFINDQLDNGEKIVIDVLKASTGKWKKCLFPYSQDGIPHEEKFLKDNFPKSYKYLLEHKQELCKRDIDNSKKNNWFLFGRTQGIKDINKNKISINSLVKDKNSIKLNLVPAGKGVYSGFYIVTTFDFKDVQQAVFSDEFIKYVMSLRKYKNGGCFTFSTKDLEQYLYYKLKGDEYAYQYKFNIFE